MRSFMNHFLQGLFSLAMPLIDFDPHSILYCRAVRFGASTIMCLYHVFLYYLQRDRFVLLYCHYLFSLASYLIFQITTQHNSFLPPAHYWYFVVDEIFILWMLISYVYFYCPGFRKTTKLALLKTRWWHFIFQLLYHYLLIYSKYFLQISTFYRGTYFFIVNWFWLQSLLLVWRGQPWSVKVYL